MIVTIPTPVWAFIWYFKRQYKANNSRNKGYTYQNRTNNATDKYAEFWKDTFYSRCHNEAEY